MFQATNILSAMQPLFYVSSIFGLAPYSYLKLLNKSYIIEGPRVSFIIWTVTVTIFVVAGYVHNLSYFFRENEYHNASSLIVIVFEKTWLFAFSVSILLLGITRNRLKMQHIFQHIIEIESSLLKNKGRIIFKKEFWSLLFQVVFVGVFHVCMLYSYVTIHQDKEKFACNFSYIIASFINTIGVIQFLFLLKILRLSCQHIGANLQQSNINYSAENKVFIVRHIHGEIPETHQLSRKLYHLRSLHFKLYEFAGLINSCYGFLMLIETTHNFVMLVRLAHSILMALERQSGTNLVIHDICLLLFYSVKATMILKTSQLTYNEPKEMLVTVHKLLLCPNLSSGCEAQLRLFATQIVDNEFEFTACGIFPLDLSTLHSIVAAAATYIIILYQLKNA
jgi:uncharacterized membrane protein